MNYLTRNLTLQIQKLTNFIVSEEENKEFYWFALIQTTFVLIGNSELPMLAVKSANKIYAMYLDYRDAKDFVGMDMCRKFLEMGFTRARRYANHHSGKKYDDNGEVRPQESDHWTCDYNRSAQIFKRVRDIVANNEEYKKQRKLWRSNESTHAVRVDALAATSNVTRQRYSRKRTKVSG